VSGTFSGWGRGSWLVTRGGIPARAAGTRFSHARFPASNPYGKALAPALPTLELPRRTNLMLPSPPFTGQGSCHEVQAEESGCALL